MKNVLAFVLGATIGSLVTWKLVNEKYKRLANEEIEEVREYYKGKKPVDIEELEHSKEVLDNMLNEAEEAGYVRRSEYSNVLTDLGYSKEDVEMLSEDPDISIEINDDGEYEVFVEPQPSVVAPYVISPDEFGDETGYDTENWTLYDDGILTDDDDQIIGEDEIGIFIGDALKHFGEYEDDSVHVRNEAKMCDIEILKLSETYDGMHGGESHVDDIR